MFTQVIQTLVQAFTSVSSLNLQSTVSNVTNVKTTQEAIAQSIKMLQEIEVTLAKQGSSAQQDERASAEAMIAARKEHKNA